MGFEMLVGLTLTNESVYQQYREAMAPILVRYGGGFRYDFKVAKTLKTENDDEINRVFVIYFKNRVSKDAFFADPEYLVAKEKYFLSSVKTTSIIAEYER